MSAGRLSCFTVGAGVHCTRGLAAAAARRLPRCRRHAACRGGTLAPGARLGGTVATSCHAAIRCCRLHGAQYISITCCGCCWRAGWRRRWLSLHAADDRCGAVSAGRPGGCTVTGGLLEARMCTDASRADDWPGGPDSVAPDHQRIQETHVAAGMTCCLQAISCTPTTACSSIQHCSQSMPTGAQLTPGSALLALPRHHSSSSSSSSDASRSSPASCIASSFRCTAQPRQHCQHTSPQPERTTPTC
jgi:hypothetical protein